MTSTLKRNYCVCPRMPLARPNSQNRAQNLNSKRFWLIQSMIHTLKNSYLNHLAYLQWMYLTFHLKKKSQLQPLADEPLYSLSWLKIMLAILGTTVIRITGSKSSMYLISRCHYNCLKAVIQKTSDSKCETDCTTEEKIICNYMVKWLVGNIFRVIFSCKVIKSMVHLTMISYKIHLKRSIRSHLRIITVLTKSIERDPFALTCLSSLFYQVTI